MQALTAMAVEKPLRVNHDIIIACPSFWASYLTFNAPTLFQPYLPKCVDHALEMP